MLDLDAAKAARREALGEAPEFVFGGQTFVLPVEMSYSAAIALTRNDLDGGLAQMLGQDSYNQFMEHEPSMADIEALMEWIGEQYEDKQPVPDEKSGRGGKAPNRGKAKSSKS